MSKRDRFTGNAVAFYSGEWYRFTFRKDGDNPPFMSYKKFGQKRSVIPFLYDAIYTASPVFLLEEESHNSDPDIWFDSIQSRLVPYSDSTLSIYHGDEFSLQAISVTVDEVDRYSDNKFLFKSLQCPMVAVSKLYHSITKSDFILWHCEAEKSRIAVVSEGRVVHYFDFWAGLKDLTDKRNVICEELQTLLGACLNRNFYAVALCKDHEFPFEDFSLFNIKPVPTIERVPELYHELYACALLSEKVVSFSTIEHQEAAEIVQKSGKLVRNIVSITTKTLLVFLILLGLWATGLFFWGKELDKKRIPNLPHLEALEKEQAQKSTKVSEYKKYQKYALWESSLTCFLNEFSSVIPRGATAKSLELTEISKEKWIVTLEIETRSTSNIPLIVEKLGTIEGVSSVRMLYSERSTKKERQVVRAQIEAELTHQREELHSGF